MRLTASLRPLARAGLLLARILPAALALCHLPAAQAGEENATIMSRGAYLARVGDCVACHTAPGGDFMAGGLALDMPYLGRVYSTNITPDADTGIGNYSFEEFDKAMRHGVTSDGRRLYPAMPYPSYARITAEDMQALYDYFMEEVPAVAHANQPDEVPWYLSARWPLGIWNALFSNAKPFTPDLNEDGVWNRGAYLVEGLGHCGTCHTPRGIALQEKALSSSEGNAFLAGSKIDGWYAKSLRGEHAAGLGTWSVEEIVELLKTGRTAKGAAIGAMAEVVGHSTQYLTDSDLYAMAKFMKTLPARDASDTSAQSALIADDGAFDALQAGVYDRAGSREYVEFCAGCHRQDGMGAPRVFPALAGNPSILATDTSSLIRVVLQGGRMATTQHDAMAFAMPALHEMTDQEVAEALTFIRSSWGNQAQAVAAADVSRERKQLDAPAASHVPSAASRAQ
ncbi:cytochrome c [Alcaligenaceae bacterium SJ-26]|nr:cytochrome c [Alcaligenaceae bacterium SJ-26]